MRLPLILILAGFLSGCASNSLLDANFVFDEKSNNDGLVVASTRTIDNCRGRANSSVLTFVGDSSTHNTRGAFLLDQAPNTRDFQNPPGHFQIRKLPAGKYTFQSMKKISDWSGTIPISSYKLSFVVKPGKIQYLGEIYGNFLDCQTVEIKIKDRRERDRKLFDQRMKNLSSSDFEYQILEVKN
jgi:hypothetical protein